MAATRLQGYSRLPGSARKYVTPTGDTISYREYRSRLEAAGAVKRLDVVSLANRRRQQRAFNDIVNQMAKVRARALDSALENARAAKMSPEVIRGLEIQRRRVKSEAIKSPSRKEALQDLKRYAHRNSNEARERTKLALMALGRREGIPDWVPVGASDRFKAGKLRRDRIPARFRPTGTRLSKG